MKDFSCVSFVGQVVNYLYEMNFTTITSSSVGAYEGRVCKMRSFVHRNTWNRIPAMCKLQHIMLRWVQTSFKQILLVTLIVVLALLYPAYTSRAYAVDVVSAQQSLDEAEAQMAAILAEYQVLEDEVAQSQIKIDEAAQEAIKAQGVMLEGREAVGKIAADEYTKSSFSEFFTLIFSSETFQDFLRHIDYVNAVIDATAQEIRDQKERKQVYESALNTLNEQRDRQQKQLTELEKKKQQAETLVANAQAGLAHAQAEEAARIEALAKEAERLNVVEQTVQETEISAEWNTGDREDIAVVAPEPEQPPAEEVEQPTPPPDTSAGWKTGIASAYGGSSDPSTPNPGVTATGAICDDYSMGVAVPMSWPNYRSYFGRAVEISYNGMTVIATVNDCGGMGGGSRSLDLQPGVFKAFGYSTCQEWGLRTVSYRFL